MVSAIKDDTKVGKISMMSSGRYRTRKSDDENNFPGNSEDVPSTSENTTELQGQTELLPQ